MPSKSDPSLNLFATVQPYRRPAKTLKERLQAIADSPSFTPEPLLYALDLHVSDRPVRIRPLPLGETGRALRTPQLVTDAERRLENLVVDDNGRRFDLSAVQGRGAFGVVRRVDVRDDIGHFVYAAKEQAFKGMLDMGPEARGVFADQTLSLKGSSVGRLADENDIMRLVGSPIAPTEILFTNDRIFSLMPLLDGDARVVSEELVDRPLSARFFWASEIVRQIAPELARMHAAAHCHRDLKLANLLVARDGALYLADYGLAAGHSRPHDIAGTPLYLAPEVYLDLRNIRRLVMRSSERAYDGRAADLWALGLVLMHAFFGPSHPFSPRGFDDWRREDLGLGVLFPDFMRSMHRGYRRLLVAAPAWHRFLYGEVAEAPRTALGGLDDTLRYTARRSIPLARLILALLDPDPRRRPPAEALQNWLPVATAVETHQFVQTLRDILPQSVASPTPAEQIVILKVAG